MKRKYFSPEFDFMRIEFEEMMAEDPRLVHSTPQDGASGGTGNDDGDASFEE